MTSVNAEKLENSRSNIQQNHSHIEKQLGNASYSVPIPTQFLLEWQKCLGGSGGEIANSIHQTKDGGYIVAGYTDSNNGDVKGHHYGLDFWVVKLEATGVIEWQRCLGGGGNDVANSIQQTKDGGYIVAGYATSNDGDVSGLHFSDIPIPSSDFWVVKLAATGVIEWQKCLGGSKTDVAYSIQQTKDEGYIVTGYDVNGSYVEDLWVAKLDSCGAIQWQKCLGGSFPEYAKSIQQTKDGGYIIAGFGKLSFWVIKLSERGAIEWQDYLGGSSVERAESIQQTKDGGYIVAGYTTSKDGDVNGNHGKEDIWVVKLYSSGAIQWQKCLGGSKTDVANSIQQTKDGGYIVAGYTYSNDGNVSGNHGWSDIWVVKLDSNGAIQWQKCLGGSGREIANSIQQTKDGGYIVAGYTYSSDGGNVNGNHGGNDIWVAKFRVEPQP